MNYNSTRGGTLAVPSARAIAEGLARDGGLYTPEKLVPLTDELMEELAGLDYAGRAARILGLYLTDFTSEELLTYAKKAYSAEKFAHPAGFDPTAPAVDGVAVRSLSKQEHVLELFWGPTSAFKDMALQMLPYLLTASLRKLGEERTACILVATSGDTGKAALEGFRDVPGTQIVVFYPNDGVSDVQKRQMITQEGENVGVCAVYGNFDDAQTGVKKVFSDPAIRETLDKNGRFFSSANSINFGRLAPQIVYYVSAYLDMVKSGAIARGEAINICVPTGNFGNILAAYFAKAMGLPVKKLICASNANNVLTDFINTGVYDRRREFFKTLSPSMDILISSNVERLLYYLADGDTAFVAGKMKELNENGIYTLDGEAAASLKADFIGYCCDDVQTRETIREVFGESRYLIDPHTAVAINAARRYRAETGDETPTLIASTASAFKFCAGVLDALTGTPAADDFEAIETLSAVAGQPAPAPLTGLRGKTVRFAETVEKDALGATACRLLGVEV
ncbi:MAG: threonine synthase [Ruminococcaceae bacterium]|nr:threonine synthase [Oscillospiraceae bacterium]